MTQDEFEESIYQMDLKKVMRFEKHFKAEIPKIMDMKERLYRLRDEVENLKTQPNVNKSIVTKKQKELEKLEEDYDFSLADHLRFMDEYTWFADFVAKEMMLRAGRIILKTRELESD